MILFVVFADKAQAMCPARQECSLTKVIFGLIAEAAANKYTKATHTDSGL